MIESTPLLIWQSYMGKLRQAAVVGLLVATTGCSYLNKFIGSDQCEGESCEAPMLLDNSDPERKWYCYGKQDGSDWQCLNESDPSKIVSIDIKKPAPRPQPADKLIVASIPKDTVLKIAKTEPQPEIRSRPAIKIPDVAPGEAGNVILQQPGSYYAVQLIALQEESGIVSYAKLNGLAAPLYAKTISHGSEWYVLLLGIYPDRDKAAAAKEEWQRTRTLKVNPWIRQLAALQEAIRDARPG